VRIVGKDGEILAEKKTNEIGSALFILPVGKQTVQVMGGTCAETNQKCPGPFSWDTQEATVNIILGHSPSKSEGEPGMVYPSTDIQFVVTEV
jgi:hypothetical protein